VLWWNSTVGSQPRTIVVDPTSRISTTIHRVALYKVLLAPSYHLTMEAAERQFLRCYQSVTGECRSFAVGRRQVSALIVTSVDLSSAFFEDRGPPPVLRPVEAHGPTAGGVQSQPQG